MASQAADSRQETPQAVAKIKPRGSGPFAKLRLHLANIFRLMIKELRSFRSDPIMLALVAYAFTIAIYAAATGASTEATNLAIAIVDEDHSGAHVFDETYDSLGRSFDRVNGGFEAAPKFPRPVVLTFLMRYYQRSRKKDALDMTRATLGAMARGGIHDQLGGGFARYATDAKWLVPHFEKMLYDNAQLANLYLDAYLTSGDARHAEDARDILDYVLRDMTHPDGGFYSAEDADSEGQEILLLDA